MQNTDQYFGSINVVNASLSTGNVTLTGSEGADTLYASAADSSIWGGAGNDLLVSHGDSVASSTFFFGKNDGNDTIQTSASATDRVMLYDVVFDDIDTDSYNPGATGFSFKLKSGAKLTVENVSETTTFTLADGNTFTYDSSTQFFKQKQA